MDVGEYVDSLQQNTAFEKTKIVSAKDFPTHSGTLAALAEGKSIVDVPLIASANPSTIPNALQHRPTHRRRYVRQYTSVSKIKAGTGIALEKS